MFIGILYAAVAGAFWGLVFVGPLLLPDYPAAWLAVGRYLAFGLIALPLALLDQGELRRLRRADWIEALKLSAVGNFVYYVCLAAAIQRAGGPLPTMIIGTLPVVIALTANRRNARRDGRLPWRRLVVPLLLIALGVACVNQAEIGALQASSPAGLARYASGAALAVAAVVCWTWYPLRNADWLRAHPERSPRAWATAQGLVTLPLAAAGAVVLALAAPWLTPGYALPLGPRPPVFVALMAAIGLFASWLGTLCWNQASQRLPTAIAGQLIVFETVAALGYAFALRGEMPALPSLAGIALLIAGVVFAARIRPEPAQA
ncbi:DMT family transporter [Tahibacter caeni]|uniref:DMT family transporter n=1 Tax=Tahibacter caeni TaxID=1453545 RepID=UPI0021477116|nr:DMT family transporter [Tahibacter caeni]